MNYSLGSESPLISRLPNPLLSSPLLKAISSDSCSLLGDYCYPVTVSYTGLLLIEASSSMIGSVATMLPKKELPPVFLPFSFSKKEPIPSKLLLNEF